VSEPRASAIVPFHGAGPLLREAVESALSQTVADLEVIVVDDASPEPAADALSGVTDERLKIVRLPRNRGAATARNAALALARAPFVSQLDADDAWEPRYLESVLPRLDDPEVGLVYTNARLLGHPQGRQFSYLNGNGHPIRRWDQLAHENALQAPTVTIRSAAARAVGGWATWLRFVEDWHMYLKLFRAGWRFEYVDEPLAAYRWPQYGLGGKYARAQLERFELIMWAGIALRVRRWPRGQIRWRVERELRRGPPDG
jgi:glycosyltransferase involved in cell wall biosynthesis